METSAVNIAIIDVVNRKYLLKITLNNTFLPGIIL